MDTRIIMVIQYDDWGNMIGMPHLQALHWNYQDELVRVDLDLNGNVAHYNYDGSKQRVRKVITQNGIKQQQWNYSLRALDSISRRYCSGEPTMGAGIDAFVGTREIPLLEIPISIGGGRAV